MANNFKITLTDNRIPELLNKLPNVVDNIVYKTALEVEKDAKASMSGGKSGRVYLRKGRSHQASAPGQAPAIDTGNLVNSIQAKRTGMGSAEVSANAEYAAALEFGSIKRNLAMRPFFKPAAERAMKNFIAALMQLEDRLR